MGQLPGRVAVVTGGGRGIGRSIALRYAREGATVVISSRTQSDLDAVVARIADEGGAPALGVVADASDRTEARRPVAEAVERFGGVDVLVNNVGGSVGRHHDPFTGDDPCKLDFTVFTPCTVGVLAERAAFTDAVNGRVISSITVDGHAASATT